MLLEVADALKSSGMLDAGYSSVNIDDCWPLRQRDAAGNIVPDPEKFPAGMSGFSRALQAKGIGLGIYTAHGNLTCQKFPGSLGHEKQDAALCAQWFQRCFPSLWIRSHVLYYYLTPHLSRDCGQV